MRQICREVKITPGCGIGADGWSNASIPPEQAQFSCLSVCYAVYRGNPAKLQLCYRPSGIPWTVFVSLQITDREVKVYVLFEVRKRDSR